MKNLKLLYIRNNECKNNNFGTGASYAFSYINGSDSGIGEDLSYGYGGGIGNGSGNYDGWNYGDGYYAHDDHDDNYYNDEKGGSGATLDNEENSYDRGKFL